MNDHFETQPIPNPLSFMFHSLPETALAFGVFATLVIELIFPFGIFFFGSKVRHFVGLGFLLLQLGIMITGNYAWINYLTIVMVIPLFNDRFLARWIPVLKVRAPEKAFCRHGSRTFDPGFFVALGAGYFLLSIRPALNLVNRDIPWEGGSFQWKEIRQVMNRSYDQFHLVNSYGLFGGVTKTRYEVIILGTEDGPGKSPKRWREYEFPCKPERSIAGPVYDLHITTESHGKFGLQQWGESDRIHGCLFRHRATPS